jgi:hypothetical protein
MTSQIWSRRAAVKETPVEAELFLVVPDGGEIYHLNALGAALWRLLAEPASEAEASDTLAIAFPDLARAAIDADVGRFFADLRQRGLLDSL